jgi:hypothetical protein
LFQTYSAAAFVGVVILREVCVCYAARYRVVVVCDVNIDETAFYRTDAVLESILYQRDKN